MANGNVTELEIEEAQAGAVVILPLRDGGEATMWYSGTAIRVDRVGGSDIIGERDTLGEGEAT